MVIGIIGAGISGLIAGKLLAKAGHEVTILEKSSGYGGRLATRHAGKNNHIQLDYGVSYFTVMSPEFKAFTAELLEKKMIKPWGENIRFYDGAQLLDRNPNPSDMTAFTAVNGMHSIGKYLGRWVDVKTDTLVGGLTYIGKNRSKKRSWMVNLSAGNTFEADAIIISTPAPQAYGIIQTTIDETGTLKLVRLIDEVNYKPAYSLMVGYNGAEIPGWQGISCQHSAIEFVSNETLKHGRDAEEECSLVVHSTETFAREHRNADEETITQKMIHELAGIAGDWTASPEWAQLHFWKFSRALQVVDAPYLEYEDENTPLALTGDYFEGNSLDDAYRSGFKLAKNWIKKYPLSKK